MGKSSAFGTTFAVGIRQVETATVVGTITLGGNATVITTASGMTGSPITTSVAVLLADTADTVAEKIRTALRAVANITAKFDISGSGPYVVLTRLIAAANDATLNISVANGDCTGLTDDTSSDATTAGVASAATSYVTNVSGPGLALDSEDVTTHDQTYAWEEVAVTILRSGEVTLDVVYDPAAGVHGLLSGYLNAKTKIFATVTWPGAVAWSFPCYVTGFEPSAAVDGALTASVTLKIDGAPTLV